jgi:hypothetical protein
MTARVSNGFWVTFEPQESDSFSGHNRVGDLCLHYIDTCGASLTRFPTSHLRDCLARIKMPESGIIRKIRIRRTSVKRSQLLLGYLVYFKVLQRSYQSD